MTRVLISTFPQDIHAAEVALALRDLGHEAVLWYGADFPTRQTASIRLGGDGVRWEIRGEELEVHEKSFDVVWFRRPSRPVLPEEDLHPGDRRMARQENESFMTGLWHLVGRDTVQVNPIGNRRGANSKAVQLEAAGSVGLTIPPTLMSNDPERIRGFLAQYEAAIYKPFFPARWSAGEGMEDPLALLVTTEVTEDQLPDDDIVRLTPGIFQAAVPKAHELRVTWMGRHTVTARLHSQESDLTRIDWRAGQGHLRVEPGELPASVAHSCQRLMNRLGLVFGCFDFIVTPEGEHIFLEVNTMGQFLWKEVAAPELTLLDDFCAFLASARPDFEGPSAPPRAHHRDYEDAALDLMKDAADRHVPYYLSFAYSDLRQEPEGSASADRESEAPDAEARDLNIRDDDPQNPSPDETSLRSVAKSE